MGQPLRLSLVQCPVWGVDDPPLGLAQLAGCVAHCGQEAHLFDLNVRFWREGPENYRPYWSWDALSFWNDRACVRGLMESAEPLLQHCVEEVLRPDPHAVLFSVARGSQWFSLELARKVKALKPDAAVLMGGAYFSRASHVGEFIQDPSVDLIVSGAGEDILPKLLGLYNACGRWVPLPGMVFKSNGSVVRGGRPVPFTFDLDIGPYADFSMFRWDQYRKPHQLPFSSSRGCPWSCYFCASREHWGRYSFTSGDLIFSQVAQALRHRPDIRHIEFYDIMANGNVPSLVRFSEMALEHGWVGRGLTWRINAAVKPEMDRKVLSRMAAGGCREIVYGIESGSPDVLKSMNKPFSLEAAERVLQDTHEAGIRCATSFLIGFPTESEEDFSQTLAFLERNRASIDSLYVSPLVIEEPSLIYRRPEQFRILRSEGSGLDANWALEPEGAGSRPMRQERLERFKEQAGRLGIGLGAVPFSIGTP